MGDWGRPDAVLTAFRLLPGRREVLPMTGIYGEAPSISRRGIFFIQIYEREGIAIVEVYEGDGNHILLLLTVVKKDAQF